MRSNIILLVEDNPDDEALTLRALNRTNILLSTALDLHRGGMNQVVVARDGVEALDYLFGTGTWAGRDASIPPQLILLDLKLPRLDGLQVLRRLRADARTALVPVAVLTSSNEDQDIARSYQLGANSYIRKLVDFDQFIDAMYQLGKYWLQLNTPPPSGQLR